MTSERVRNRVKIFVGTTIDGVEGVERTVNKWLDNNPLVQIRSVQLATTDTASIVTVWYSGSEASLVRTPRTSRSECDSSQRNDGVACSNHAGDCS